MSWFDGSSGSYDVGITSRCLASQTSEPDLHRFLVGTSSIHHSRNQIHLLDLDDDSNEVRTQAVYSHEQEIDRIRASPTNVELFATLYRNHDKHTFVSVSAFSERICKTSKSSDPQLSDAGKDSRGDDDISKIQDELDDFWDSPDIPVAAAVSRQSVQEMFELDEQFTCTASAENIKDILWRPQHSNILVTVGAHTIRTWDINTSSVAQESSSTVIGNNTDSFEFHKGCWDTTNPANFLVSMGNELVLFDTRSGSKPSLEIPNAHSKDILDIDFNPNKPHHVISGGKDRLAKFWDLRNPSAPIRVLSNHSHWVSQVRYNPFHDQLVLTAGTDGTVNLWSILSTSSSPIDSYSSNERDDKLIAKIDDHDDSVYGLEWSSCDAWVFASLSYDGKVAFNRVPQGEKYKILL